MVACFIHKVVQGAQDSASITRLAKAARGAYVVGPHEYRVRGWKGAMGGLGVDIRARRACPSLS